MSASTVSHDYIGDKPAPKPARAKHSVAYKVVQAVASLRVTVVLFSLSMVLVFFGTLGMMHISIDEAVNHYFRCWFAWIDLQGIADFGKVFLPSIFSPDARFPVKLPFPGGYVIGWAMFINLLAAHITRFKLTWKRLGIWVLHAGVIVLLAGEFFTGQYAVETRMVIKEGGSSDYAFSLSDQELAIIDQSNPGHDDVIVVSGATILNGAKKDWLSHPDVPFDIKLAAYHENARLRQLRPGEPAVADQGAWKNYALDERPKVKGTDTGGEINLPAVCLTFRDKGGELLGTFLFALQREDRLQDIVVGGKTYKVTYRSKRTYKPYVVHVDKTEHDVYPGTNIPKDYASTVRVDDPVLGEHGPIRIWMNHPMYYRGETYYQSSMPTDEETGATTTGFQVVENPAWTFPYFACGMVALGMVVHFLIRLITFLSSARKLAAKTPLSRPTATARSLASAGGRWKLVERYFPAGVVALFAVMVLGKMMTPSVSEETNDLYGFGKIPVQQGGRVQPLDSVARNSLMVISSKQEFVDGQDHDKVYKAIDWLLMLWAKPEKANEFRIFRIDHPQILSLLALPQRPGSYRYSMAELAPGMNKLRMQVSVANRKPREKKDHYDLKLLELAKHMEVYQDLEFRRIPGIIPTGEPNTKWLSYGDVVEKVAPKFFEQASAAARIDVEQQLQNDRGLLIDLLRRHFGDERELDQAAQQFGGKDKVIQFVIEEEVRARARPIARENFLKALPETYPAAAALDKILDEYKSEKPPRPEAFNAAVAAYQAEYTSELSDSEKTRVSIEARMNYVDPFLQCIVLYIAVIVLAALSWLVWHEPLRKSAFWLACFALVIHTGALVARMYIGNRPPVTNLYSSAVFIGWGGLALCLVLERIYKLGVGSFAGACIGFGTMLIARFLAESGDTLEMLEAVLDTNFWLATHVTCVTLGYVATFVGGLIGIVYVIGGVFTTAMRGQTGKQVAGMMYGTLCFATLLSFTGTVLGGIWADQSWGRFWGWDPKENGAVLIVIWNALILHARWCGLVKARGMAILAVVGNMWTAWSWFGTNQLGIGLHAYGFDNRLATGCAVFWLSQSLIAALGMVPTRFWASFAPTTPQTARA
jgi:ABC-type transport system involved in cytochrome c biogenesis permease subunit